MPRTGEAIGSGLGDPKSKMLRNWIDVLAGGTLRMRFIPFGKFRDKGWICFTNARYRSYSSPELNQRNVVLPLDPFSATASGECVEIGVLGPQNPDDVTWEWLAGWCEEADEDDAKKLRLVWTALPLVVTEAADSIQSITISGANRFSNVQEIEEFPSRARVRYTVKAVGTDRFVQWFNGDKLIASGNRSGDGLVTMSEQNDSGVSGQCVLTYTGDADDWFDLRWAAQYQVYYSASPIVWSGTPQAIVYDRGVDSFTYLSGTVDDGLLYFGVRAVGDDNVLEAIPQEAPNSPLTINDVPNPPTNLDASGTYDNLQITWTGSTTPYCYYTVYSSLVDEPPNIENLWPDPVPVITGIGYSSAILPTVANYAPLDKTSVWSTFTTACNTWLTNINLTLDVSVRATHWDLVEAQKLIVLAAVKTLGDAIDRDLNQFANAISLYHLALQRKAQLSADMIDADWLAAITPFHEQLLDAMAFFYNGRKGNFQMPDGTLPMSSVGGKIEFSIYDYVKPLVQNRIVRVIVRATSQTNIQEKSDYVLEIELDENGAVVIPRPNQPAIESIEADGLTVTINALWQEEDTPADADTIQAWVVATGVAPNPAIPSGTDDLVEGLGETFRASPVITVGSEGYYDIYIAALSGDGGQSLLVGPKTRWISNDDPYEAQNVSGQIVRSA